MDVPGIQTSISISARSVMALMRSSIHEAICRSSSTSQSLEVMRAVRVTSGQKCIPHIRSDLLIPRSPVAFCKTKITD